MWQTVDYNGNTVKWYEAELIEKIKAECQEAIKNDLINPRYFLGNRILNLIEENEG